MSAAAASAAHGDCEQSVNRICWRSAATLSIRERDVRRPPRNAQPRPAPRRGAWRGRGDAPGPLLIIAGAGSGKTNTLAHRVAHLVVNGANPGRILLMTFSRRAANEMTRRVERIVARALPATSAPPTLAWSGTFHGIGARLLREYAGAIGLDPAFTIHDREDSADLMNLVRHELGLSHTEKRFPTKATCLAIYSRTVNQEAALADVLAAVFPWCAGWQEELSGLFARLYGGQAEPERPRLRRPAALSGGDAGGAGHRRGYRRALRPYPGRRISGHQPAAGLDPHGAQAGRARVVVVGDDAQSIYSFRAATVRNILDFPKAFSPPAAVVTLSRNYRSTQAILAASNAVIGLAEERYAKELWSERASGDRPALVVTADEADQARYVVERVLQNREGGMALKEQAVLFRAAHHSGQLEIELTRRNIPFVKYGGLKFLDAAHVKDVLALLRFAGNPRDRVSGFRVLQLLPGIGPSSAADVLDLLAQSDAAGAVLATYQPPARAAADWPGFAGLATDLRAGRAGWPAEMERVRLWYEPHLERIHEDAVIRRNDLLQLEQIAAGYPSRERFLTELTLDPPDATSDEAGPPFLDEDYLILSTIHSAKGQEWKSVFVLNGIDGCIPSDLGVGTSGRDRGGAAAALCRHDAGEGRAGHHGAAALLRAAAAPRRRPPSLRPAHALHSRGDPLPFPREPVAAGSRRTRRGRATAGPRVDVGRRLRQRWG